MASPVKIVAVLTAKPGLAGDLERLLRGMAAPSRNESGNLHYNLWRNHAQAGQFILDEMYVDAAANEAHRASPHFQNYAAHVGNLADRVVYVLDGVDTT